MPDKEIAALVGRLRVLSTKQPDYDMSYHARGHGLSGNAEIHLFGKRAEAAHWLMENAPTLIASLTTPSDRASGQGDGWLPIETAPKDGTPILLSDGRMVAQGWWIDDAYPWYFVDDVEHENRDRRGCWIELNQALPKAFTHWRPLPTPPSDVVPGEQERGE